MLNEGEGLIISLGAIWSHLETGVDMSSELALQALTKWTSSAVFLDLSRG
jgi:hypothetical protein